VFYLAPGIHASACWSASIVRRAFDRIPLRVRTQAIAGPRARRWRCNGPPSHAFLRIFSM